jgi:uncharacterized protein (TIGR00297 family)
MTNYLLPLLNPPWSIAIAINSVLVLVAAIVPKKLLTPMGLLHAWLLGVLVWGGLGWRGYAIVMLFFLVGSTVTRIGKASKEAAGIAEARDGARSPKNLWGAAATGAICTLGTIAVDRELLPLAWGELLWLGYTASFATKLADTTASEIGKAYGKKTYLITTLQPVPRGTEGAISLEGTLAGIGGGLLVAIVGYGIGAIDLNGLWICTLAAFIATNIESVIGATIQVKFTWLSNELVNAINTFIGATIAMAIAAIVG